MGAVVYHITTGTNAAAIASGGFRDATGQYMSTREHTGVWVSDRPLIGDCDVDDFACFEIIVDGCALAPYEWIEEGKGYREWLVPAELLNQCPRRQISGDEAFQRGI